MSLGEKFYHVEVAGDAIIPVIAAISANALANVMLRRHGLENVAFAAERADEPDEPITDLPRHQLMMVS